MVRVERRVMKQLFWSHDPVMSSVYASEAWVQHLRDTVGTALERAVAPATEYLETLEPFVEFLNVDGEVSLFLRNTNVCYSYVWLTSVLSLLAVTNSVDSVAHAQNKQAPTSPRLKYAALTCDRQNKSSPCM